MDKGYGSGHPDPGDPKRPDPTGSDQDLQHCSQLLQLKLSFQR